MTKKTFNFRRLWACNVGCFTNLVGLLWIPLFVKRIPSFFWKNTILLNKNYMRLISYLNEFHYSWRQYLLFFKNTILFNKNHMRLISYLKISKCLWFVVKIFSFLSDIIALSLSIQLSFKQFFSFLFIASPFFNFLNHSPLVIFEIACSK